MNFVPYKKSQSDLLAALAEERAAIRNSCVNYDAGQLWEAKRLASSVYKLVKDGKGNNKSLLGQLNLNPKLKYITSSKGIKDGVWPKLPLVNLFMGDNCVSYIPIYINNFNAENIKRVSFSTWWDEPIYQEMTGSSLGYLNRGRFFSRKNLVHAMRDQDGGAHWDGTLTNEIYCKLAIKGETGFESVVDGVKVPSNAHLATMRQIAWEMEKTLEAIKII